MDTILMYVFFSVIIVLDVIYAAKWYLIATSLNKKLNQSFSPILYALFSFIPLTNPFIVWFILKDIKEYQIKEKMENIISVPAIWLKLEIIYFLMIGSATAVMPVFLIIGSILMALGVGMGEILINFSPLIAILLSFFALFWLNKEIKKLDKSID